MRGVGRPLQIIGVAFACLVLAGGLAACSSSPKPKPAQQSGQRIATESDLLNLIQTDGLTPLRAEQLFALDVAQLPGVSVAGIRRTKGFDGTEAANAVIDEWTHLPSAVKSAIIAVIPPPPGIPGFASATAALLPAASGGNGPRLSVQPPACSSQSGLFDYQTLISDALSVEAAKTSTAVPQFRCYADNNYPATGPTWAEAVLFDPGYTAQPGGCQIYVYTQKFSGLDANTAAGILAHEAFHCFQERQAQTVTSFESVHGWITEGEATWVMEQLHPGSSSPISAWPLYAQTPTGIYSQRRYDGVGVFGHQGDVAHSQDSVWTQLLPVFTAGIGGHDDAPFTLLMGGDSDSYYTSWGSSYFEEKASSPWYMAGPGTPPTSGPYAPVTYTVNNGAYQDITTGKDMARAVYLQPGTGVDIVLVVMPVGYGRVHDSGFTVDQRIGTTAPIALCVKSGGCKCPDGTPGASEFTTQATPPISLGLDGGDTGLIAYVHGDSLDKYCQQPDPPPPGPSTPGSNGGGGGGSSGSPQAPPPPAAHTAGDPHLLTFDGTLYDLQAVGEFTLVKSTVDDLLIQVRQVPLSSSQTVAVNHDVAMKVDGHRVTLQLENEVPVVRIDGVVDNYEQSSVGAGTIERLGTEIGAGFVVEWPDQTTLHITQMGGVGLNLSITTPASRRGKVTGLLGPDSGGASDHFIAGDGTDLGATPTPAVIHGQFADSWRITQAQSLFDYQPGQTTDTFTNRAFPTSFVTPGTVPGAAAAATACKADGITDQQILADCTIDAASVGDQTVLTSYAQAQVVATVSNNLAHGQPAFSPGVAPGGATTPEPTLQAGTLIDTGNVTDRSSDQSFPIPAQAGQIIWLGPPGCDDSGLTFVLRDPQGNSVKNSLGADLMTGGLSGCEAGRFDLSMSGTYELVANGDHQRTGKYSIPIRFLRPDNVRQISYGSSVSGTIDQQGAHDVYQFQAHAGDIITLTGTGCTVAGANGLDVQVSSTHDIPAQNGVGARKDIFGIDCGQKWQVKLTDTYSMTVNWENEPPFSYRFQLEKTTAF